MASFSRDELKSRLLDATTFQPILELEPRMVDLVNTLYACQYGELVDSLKILQPDLQLNFHLSRHVPHLYKLIRRNAILQYIQPFKVIDLTAMSTTFKISLTELYTELVDYIKSDHLKARLDTRKNVCLIPSMTVSNLGRLYAHWTRIVKQKMLNLS